jgi:hypothetical protein
VSKLLAKLADALLNFLGQRQHSTPDTHNRFWLIASD